MEAQDGSMTCAPIPRLQMAKTGQRLEHLESREIMLDSDKGNNDSCICELASEEEACPSN